jgi:hypothetical protein
VKRDAAAEAAASFVILASFILASRKRNKLGLEGLHPLPIGPAIGR